MNCVIERLEKKIMNCVIDRAEKKVINNYYLMSEGKD
jgi:hypothetical protein